MKTATTIVIFLSLLIFSTEAQTTYDTHQLNRAIMREFSGEQLQTMMDSDLQRLEKITLYFNHSFTVEDYNCSECPIDKIDLFNISLFNVYDHETERLENQEITFLYKEKYSITLLSKSDLNNLLDGKTPFELIHGLPERAFPSWVSESYEQIDFESYKTELQLWSTDFPKLYLKKKQSVNVLKVHFSQFCEMTNSERTAVLTFPGGYIIVDEEIMNYPQ